MQFLVVPKIFLYRSEYCYTPTNFVIQVWVFPGLLYIVLVHDPYSTLLYDKE